MQPFQSLNGLTPCSGKIDREWQKQRVADWLRPHYEDAEERAERIVNRCANAPTIRRR
jgi:hypothetical protein